MLHDTFKMSADADELATAHLRTFRFDIAGTYVPLEWDANMFVTWDELKAEIPGRMTALLNALREEQQVIG
ncbi:hypothetical protein D3C77_700030 [compost metagenome]